MKFLDARILAETNLVCPFARAEALIDQDDPSRESLLQSRSFLMEVFAKLETIMEKLDKEDEARNHAELLQTVVHYMQGTVSWSLGDGGHAENELKVALMNLPQDVIQPAKVMLALSVWTELARLYCQRKHFEEADKYYARVSTNASKYLSKETSDPFSLQDLFSPGIPHVSPSGKSSFNDMTKEANDYLAMRGKLSTTNEDFIVQHDSFVNDFEKRVVTEETMDNCLALVTFFAERDNFEHARKYLCLADALVGKTDISIDNRETAFVFCKLKYYQHLMRASAEKLQERKRVMILKKKVENLERFSFNTSCRNNIIQHEKYYRTLTAKDWNEAKVIFLDAKKIVDHALKNFAVEGNLLKNIEVNQILNKIYHHLTAFHQDKIASSDSLDRVCKMHWRRIKCLETSLAQCSNDNGDLNVKVQELTFELADVYLKLLEMKQKKFERTAGNLDPVLLQKMTYYCFTGIKRCQRFLSTLGYKDAKTTFADDMVQAAILTLFRIGKFYAKIFTPIGDDQVKFTELAIESYQAVVDYCQYHPHHLRHVTSEHSQCLNTIDMLQRQLKMHAKATQEQDQAQESGGSV